MKAIISISSLALLALWSMSFSYTFPAKTWKHLGSRTVNFKLEKDVIQVGAREGGFRKIKIKVTGASLNMHRMVVAYGNGQKEKIPVKYNFNRGSETRIIDLNGGVRAIKQITVWYDTKNTSRRKAKVHLFGRR